MIIDLDDKIKEDIKNQVVKDVTQTLTNEMINQVRATLNIKQLRSEVINKVVLEISDHIIKNKMKTESFGSVIEKTLESVEHRIHKEVKEKLEKGINVSFK